MFSITQGKEVPYIVCCSIFEAVHCATDKITNKVPKIVITSSNQFGIKMNSFHLSFTILCEHVEMKLPEVLKAFKLVCLADHHNSSVKLNSCINVK